MQILSATRSRMYKVDESGHILELHTLDSYPVHFARHLACVAGGISRASAFVLVAKP